MYKIDKRGGEGVQKSFSRTTQLLTIFFRAFVVKKPQVFKFKKNLDISDTF